MTVPGRLIGDPDPIPLEDLAEMAGREFGPTAWLTVDQTRIDAFADATGDHQWIHVDSERAAEGPFGATIAHGHLTLGLCSHFLLSLYTITGASMAINYGVDRVRFPSAVVVGSRLRARARIVDVASLEGGFQTKTRVEIEIDGGPKPACVAELLARYLR